MLITLLCEEVSNEFIIFDFESDIRWVIDIFSIQNISIYEIKVINDEI